MQMQIILNSNISNVTSDIILKEDEAAQEKIQSLIDKLCSKFYIYFVFKAFSLLWLQKDGIHYL